MKIKNYKNTPNKISYTACYDCLEMEIDAITNDVMFQMSGRMSIKADTHDKQLEIVVENGKNKYQKHIIGLSDNVSYVVEDVDVPNVSKYKYEINYNPKMWVPVKLKNVD